MSWRFCLILFIGVLLEWKFTLSATAEIGKTKDKGRAYEFGFSIEEQQHRHEKKDENGIVMGEFGFITADGIYHVTVYATDENGKFKIISMKNYPYGNPEKKIMIAMIPPAKKPEATPTVVQAMKPDGKSCGGCVLPKKLNQLPADVMGKKPDDEKAVFRPLSKALNDLPANGKATGGTPTNQSNSLSKSTSGTPQQGGAANGKGFSASQQPLPKLPGSKSLVPPRISTPGAQKVNSVGATSSKVDPGIPGNNGNKHQSTNFLTQTTPTQLLAQTPGTGSQLSRFPSQNGQFSSTTRRKPFQSNPSITPTKPSTNNGNYQAIYNTASLTTKIPIKPFGISTYNTNTTPQHFLNSQTKTNPTRTSTQLAKNKENKSITPKKSPKMSYQFGFSGLENQIVPTSFGNENNLPEVEGSFQTTKFPNPFHSSNFPSDVPEIYNTKSKSPSSSVSLSNNPTRSFAIPALNRKTPSSQQQGSTNPLTQNAVKPIQKSTKETKPFQTLSKILPDPDGSIQNGTPLTSTLTTNSRNTVLQKPGQGPSQVTSAKPQPIGKNTLTQQTLTPKRLQQNTNGAKTSTTNTQSTNKQTPVAPSSQSVGKTTSANNARGGIGGASSSGNAAGSGGGGGGPLYRFKYVLDYNSHREEGRIDGSKEGKYNTLHDDGIRRIIDYIANENGYQPHIRLERPPSNELPTGENKLKEYEFVWFN